MSKVFSKLSKDFKSFEKELHNIASKLTFLAVIPKIHYVFCRAFIFIPELSVSPS